MSSGRLVSVHIGGPKTGSTAVQAFLSRSLATLRDRGVLYPDVCLRGFGHHDLAFLVGGGYPVWATPQERGLESLALDLDRALMSESLHVVLSSEDFFLYPRPEVLKALIDRKEHGRRTQIIVYIRRQDQMAVSWYNQAVKAQGYAGDFEACERETRHLWDYRVQLATWATAFGEENMRVRVYEPGALKDGDICADLLEVLGIDGLGLPGAGALVNTNLNRDLVEFQRQVNRLPLEPAQKRRFHKELIALTEATRGQGLFEDTPFIGPSGRRAILEHYAEQNRAVARQWFGREELFSAVDPTEPEPGPYGGLDLARSQLIYGWILARSGLVR